VTLTLPVDVIDALSSSGSDISRTIVRLAALEGSRRAYPPAELVTFGRHAVIAVTPSKTLEKRTGVSLVPLPDGRALISFEQALSIPALELLIADALDDRLLPSVDRAIFQSIAEILKTARRDADITLMQRSIIVLRGRRRAKAPAAAPR
jgi:hypothetical protein